MVCCADHCHLTDTHLFADADSSPARHGRGTASLSAVLEHIVVVDWEADLVAVTGDLIQDDTRGAYRTLLRRMLKKLDLTGLLRTRQPRRP